MAKVNKTIVTVYLEDEVLAAITKDMSDTGDNRTEVTNRVFKKYYKIKK